MSLHIGSTNINSHKMIKDLVPTKLGWTFDFTFLNFDIISLLRSKTCIEKLVKFSALQRLVDND